MAKTDLIILRRYIKKHGKAKTAVALGSKETNAINNWLQRNEVPEKQVGNIRFLKEFDVEVRVYAKSGTDLEKKVINAN